MRTCVAALLALGLVSVRVHWAALPILTLSLQAAGAQMRAARPSAEVTFRRDVQAALKHLTSSDIKQLRPYLSKQGVYVVNRSKRYTAEADKIRATNEAMAVGNRYVLVYVDTIAEFTFDETKGRDFRAAIKDYSEHLAEAKGHQAYVPYRSISGYDRSGMRYLGPSVMFKQCSSHHYYLYFRLEGGTWKIWKFELASRT